MSNKYYSMPAFPSKWPRWGIPKSQKRGMTLLDWFAGQAMMGMLAGGERGKISDIAQSSYLIAGAMLAMKNEISENEREKSELAQPS